VGQPGAPILTFGVHSTPRVLRIELRGELDLSCGELFDCLFDIDVSQSPTVVLDLRDLSFCDVVGVNALTGLRDYYVHLGRRVRLVNAAPHVARLMELLEIRDRLVASRRSAGPADWWDTPDLR
jgi:anti-anti-sigma factor